MKNIPFLFLFLAFFACENAEQKNNKTTNLSPSAEAEKKVANLGLDFTIDFDQVENLTFEKLRLYPITATDTHIESHAELARFKNLKEAMTIKGFHITEKKPFGRFDDSGAVNSLTVQNKSQDTIYLMAGDVIQGGKQDRLIAQDMVVLPRTIVDVAVFCVEPNRWEVRPEMNSKPSPKAKQKQYAFTGYYNVASNEIRKTAKQTGDQNAVWEKVGEWTALNKASSATGTYAALEDSEGFTTARDEYINFYSNRMDLDHNTIGLIAVSGDRVLGADIFNHPDLFKKQFPALLHAYVTDAVTKGRTVDIQDASMEKFIKKMKINYGETLSSKKEKEAKFRYNGKIVHFSYLP